MRISFDNALGIHSKALVFRSSRAEVLASNLINADTPNYKARDIRFSDSLASVQNRNISLRRTNPRHLDGGISSSSNDRLYRVPTQIGIDGNTVNAEIEESNYMRNAVEFQTSFTFLNGRFRGLAKAIAGE